MDIWPLRSKVTQDPTWEKIFGGKFDLVSTVGPGYSCISFDTPSGFQDALGDDGWAQG